MNHRIKLILVALLICLICTALTYKVLFAFEPAQFPEGAVIGSADTKVSIERG